MLVTTLKLTSGGTSSFTVIASMNVLQVSIKVNNVTGYTGTLKGGASIAGNASVPINLLAGDVVTLTAPSNTSPIDSLAIICTNGEIDLILSQNL